jgi:hypothetical protein
MLQCVPPSYIVCSNVVLSGYLLGNAPTGTWTIALDPTFGSFTLLELVSRAVTQFLWWKCLECLDWNGLFWFSECGHSKWMYNILSIGRASSSVMPCFYKNHEFWVLHIYQRTTASFSSSKTIIKELMVPIIFKNLLKAVVTKELVVLWELVFKFLTTVIIYQIGFWSFWKPWLWILRSALITIVQKRIILYDLLNSKQQTMTYGEVQSGHFILISTMYGKA